MSISLRELVNLFGGKLQGDGEITISGAATIRDAQPGEITLADGGKMTDDLARSQASAVVVPPTFPESSLPRIIVSDVRKYFAQIVVHFRPRRSSKSVGVSPTARVSPFAKIGNGVNVHPGAAIGDDVTVGARSTIHSGVQIMAGCVIGECVTIFPNAVLYEDSIVGDRCIIHSNAVIGSYGFGYSTVDGQHHLSPQLGYVEIGSDVEVGACSTIDRGTYGPTLIGEGTKMDNHVMIAHNCRIGKCNILCSQVGIAGSCTTGDYVVMGGQVGVADHNNIGHHVSIGAQTGVFKDIPDGESHLGTPSSPIREQARKYSA